MLAQLLGGRRVMEECLGPQRCFFAMAGCMIQRIVKDLLEGASVKEFVRGIVSQKVDHQASLQKANLSHAGTTHVATTTTATAAISIPETRHHLRAQQVQGQWVSSLTIPVWTAYTTHHQYAGYWLAVTAAHIWYDSSSHMV
jgi:hypothetical protein